MSAIQHVGTAWQLDEPRAREIPVQFDQTVNFEKTSSTSLTRSFEQFKAPNSTSIEYFQLRSGETQWLPFPRHALKVNHAFTFPGNENRIVFIVNDTGLMWYREIELPSSSWTAEYPWLQQARQLDKQGREDLALRTIYRNLNDWLIGGEIDRCNRLLVDADVKDISTGFMLAILTVTLRYHSQLRARSDFVRRVREALRKEGLNERALMHGLG